MPTAFLLPTTYAGLTLLSSLILFELPLLEWEGKSSVGSLFLILACALMFASSSVFTVWLDSVRFRPRTKGYARPWPVALLSAIGTAGISLYVLDFSEIAGGLPAFMTSLTTNPLEVRALAEEGRSFGTQISYFGWISAALSAHRLSGRPGTRLDSVNILATLILNLAFVDRTRPIWIAVTCLLAFLVGRDREDAGRALRLLAGALLGTVVFFLGWVLVTGKSGGQHEDDLLGALANLTHYVTAGPAYFSHLLDNAEPSWSLSNLLSPLYSVLALMGGPPPPSSVLEAVWIPLSTNVGTGFEPFYMSGGWPGLLVSLFVYCLAFNIAAVFFLSRGGAGGILGWSHLCFTSLILFFVPKINNFSLWLLLSVALVLCVPAVSKRLEILPNRAWMKR